MPVTAALNQRAIVAKTDAVCGDLDQRIGRRKATVRFPFPRRANLGVWLPHFWAAPGLPAQAQPLTFERATLWPETDCPEILAARRRWHRHSRL